MKKSELKQLIKEVISEDIFLQNRKSPEEKAKTRELEKELEKELKYKIKFGVEVYKGDIKLTKQILPYFKKYSKIKKTTGYFYCNHLELKSLTELPIPKEIGKWFNCSYNNLTTLEGAPEKVGGSIWCDNNDLTTLKGAPKYVGKNFHCYENKVKFTEEDVKRVCDVKDKIYC